MSMPCKSSAVKLIKLPPGKFCFEAPAAGRSPWPRFCWLNFDQKASLEQASSTESRSPFAVAVALVAIGAFCGTGWNKSVGLSNSKGGAIWQGSTSYGALLVVCSFDNIFKLRRILIALACGYRGAAATVERFCGGQGITLSKVALISFCWNLLLCKIMGCCCTTWSGLTSLRNEGSRTGFGWIGAKA